ncbi:MAG: M1 family aminopeptidase [Thermoanaerobaculia bacterium]
MRRTSMLAALAFLLARQAHASTATEELASALSALAGAELQADQAVRVANLKLGVDLGVLRLQDGVLVPATAVAGRPAEFVFCGHGRLTIDPPDDIEADQLEVFTGEARFDQTFENAVLVVALDAASDGLWSRRQKIAPSASERAAVLETWSAWKSGALRRRLGVELALASDALHDPGYASYFALWMRKTELGEAVFLSDPEAFEQVTLGQFVPLADDAKEKRDLGRELGRLQRRGRALGVGVDDLGTFDQWLSGARRRANGEISNGWAAIEPSHYAIDIALADDRDLSLTARAAVSFAPKTLGRTVARFALSADLEVTAVAGADGAPLAFARRGGDLLVALDPPLGATDSRTLEIRYRGKLLDKSGKAWGLADTLGWYPHAGDLDRATFDVTFRWPGRLQLLASGHRVDGGTDASGERWERRQLDVAGAGFSFEVGKFKLTKTTAGPVAITVAFDPDTKQLDNDVEREIVDTVARAVEYFSATFGPYPLPELTVVTVPRFYSQGLLGFVTLSQVQLWDFGQFASWFNLEDRRTVIAHEIAHQWWGNTVGFATYRDGWMSEALANYSALVFGRNKLEWKERPRIGPTTGWQHLLLEPTPRGRPVEALGPVVLGGRLVSSQSDRAYQEIVYLKGAIVFDMLAKRFGEEPFLHLLAEIERVSAGRNLSTEIFLSAVEKMTGADLAPFAAQYVYGTGIPEVGYRYDFAAIEGGKWRVSGQVHQSAPIHFSYAIEKLAEGRFDVSRHATPEIAGDKLRALDVVVPFQVEVEPPAGESRADRKRLGDHRWVEGRVALRGESTDFSLMVDQTPKRLYLDLAQEVLGRFADETRELKRMRLRAALELAARGDAAAAEVAFRRVFDEPVLSTAADEDDSWDASKKRQQGRILDARAHLGLARLCLDRRGANCDRDLEAAKQAAGTFDRFWIDDELDLLEARFDLQRGDAARVLRKLRKAVLRYQDLDQTEAWMLLAIAARAERDDETWTKASAEVKKRGVDLSALEPAAAH